MKALLTLKTASYCAAALGLAAIIVLTQRHGFGDILDLFVRAGWPLLLLVPFHTLPLLLDAMGWRVLVAPYDAQRRAQLPYLFWASTIREAVARLLPLASVGGELVGVRLAMLRGLDGAIVTAGIVVQLLLSIVNQYLFALLGFGLVLLQPGAAHVVRTIGIGLLVTAPIAPIVFLLLRSGRLFERLQGWLAKFVGESLRQKLGLDGGKLDRAIRDYLLHPRLLLTSAAWEFAGIVIGSFENWLALRLLGHPVDLLTALSLEAAAQSVRRVFFMMPAGLGVQEAGLAMIGPLLGVPAELAITLSLCKRMRDVLFGVPALLSWQWLEVRRGT